MGEFVFSKKNMILLGIVILLIGLYVIFVLFFNEKSTSSKGYIYVSNFLIWEYKNNKFVQVTEMPEEDQEHDYTVYDGVDKKSARYAQFVNDKWHFWDDDYNDVDTKNFRIASTGLDDISVDDFNLELYDSNDDKYISLVNNTNNQEELTLFKNSLVKVDVDLDGDNQDETLYTMSSYSLSITEVGYAPVSYLFIVDDGNVSVIAKSEGMDPFSIAEVFDVDGDGLFEVVVSKGVLNLPTLEDCYQIYEYKDGKYQLKQDCIVK